MVENCSIVSADWGDLGSCVFTMQDVLLYSIWSTSWLHNLLQCMFPLIFNIYLYVYWSWNVVKWSVLDFNYLALISNLHLVCFINQIEQGALYFGILILWSVSPVELGSFLKLADCCFTLGEYAGLFLLPCVPCVLNILGTLFFYVIRDTIYSFLLVCLLWYIVYTIFDGWQT